MSVLQVLVDYRTLRFDTNLTMELFQAGSQIFTVVKHTAETYFAFFPKSVFLHKMIRLAQENSPLTFSDPAENFIANTLEVGPKVESVEFNFELAIGT